jgi:hypothetical protein
MDKNFFDEDDAEVALSMLDAIKKNREQRGRKRSFTDTDAARFGLKDGMHRPGFRYGDTLARDETIAAYALRDAQDAEAWRGGAPTGEREFIGAPRAGAIMASNTARAGMSCAVRSGIDDEGSRGILTEIDGAPGWLECTPIASDDDGCLRETSDAATVQKKHREKMASLYDAYDRELK